MFLRKRSGKTTRKQPTQEHPTLSHLPTPTPTHSHTPKYRPRSPTGRGSSQEWFKPQQPKQEDIEWEDHDSNEIDEPKRPEPDDEGEEEEENLRYF